MYDFNITKYVILPLKKSFLANVNIPSNPKPYIVEQKSYALDPHFHMRGTLLEQEK